MKNILLAFLSSIFIIACTESSLQSSDGKQNPKIEVRSNLNELVFGSGISKTPYYNQLTDEYEYTISSDFEIRPYGDPNWYPNNAAKIKIKCICLDGTCTSHLDDSGPIVASCDNDCGSPYHSYTCTMKLRLTHTSNDSTIVEYEGGADVRLQ